MIDPELQRWADQQILQLEDEGRIIIAVLLNVIVVLILRVAF
jgi:hypothetical protein